EFVGPPAVLWYVACRSSALRHLSSRMPAPAHGRSTHQRPLLAAGRLALPRCFSSPDSTSRGRFAPGNGASLLGPVRAGCPEKSRPLALDVQALALSSAGGESGGVSILREYFGGFRAPSR